ncbi:MAG: NAD-dependent epimerase/dehydratase family protein [bacterium]
MHNICIIGAGYIAHIHVEALQSISGVRVSGVCDTHKERAVSFARRWNIANVFGSIEEVIESKSYNFAHVLVPPNLHMKVTLPLLEAGLNVFLEKPMAVTSDECKQLIEASRQAGVKLGINHNFVYHPAFLMGKEKLKEGSLGNIHHVISYWNFPLRQLASKQFGHWMFQAPQNIVLEQATHPLSQVCDIAGQAIGVNSVPTGCQELAPGKSFYDTWQISMSCEKATAQLFCSVGQDFPAFGMIVICEDGQLNMDFLNNQCSLQKKTRWMEFFNSYLNGLGMAKDLAKQSFRNASDYLLSTVKIKPRSDSYFLSMKNSIQAFHKGGDGRQLFIDGERAASIIEICEQITKDVAVRDSLVAKRPEIFGNTPKGRYDALLIGGTGFIGRKLVGKMIEAGQRVLVVARNTRLLPAVFSDPRVKTVSGNISDKHQIKEIMAGIPVVIHLAHGGGGDTWEEIKASMVEGTANIAEACLKNGVKRLIYVGSIASLYLGDKNEVITGRTPSDPWRHKRAFYSRGKATCEELLLKLHEEKGLPVCILRPGIVIGDGGGPFHSGVGLFNQDVYCLGWNGGNNPLPFVLVDDVAEAIWLAVQAEDVSGRSYNIVGDVRLTAGEYIRELGQALGRKLHYLPQSPLKMELLEVGKWIIKVGLQRRKAPFPSYRDLKSRGMISRFDCSDIKRDLHWRPGQDRAEFIRKGIEVYRKKRSNYSATD